MERQEENSKDKVISPLAQAWESAPTQTGVYLMKNAQGKVIYVGKAKNIRKRLRAYLALSDNRTMVPFLVANIASLEFIVTNTEKEALILENNLIKMHRPTYNVFFRDDRTYYCIAIDKSHPFPAVTLTRAGLARKGDKNFGPFPSSASAKKTLLFLQSVFLIRSCKDGEFARRQRPCMEYQIKRCSAPCVGKITPSEYRHAIENLSTFLDGGHKRLITALQQQMREAAAGLDFEKAALLRNQIASLENATEKQAVTIDTGKHIDIFGLFGKDGRTQASVMFIRTGKLLGSKNLPIIKKTLADCAEGAFPSAIARANARQANAELLAAILKAYYGQSEFVPDVIVTPMPSDDRKAIGEWLSQKKGGRVQLVSPQTGKLAALTKMAIKNAEAALEAQSSKEVKLAKALLVLAERLALPKVPHHIECFDISNIGGVHASGAKVAFIKGKACQEMYRHYRIKTQGGADDYAMMREMLLRRFSPKSEPPAGKEEGMPDLLIIDGGRGHLAVAQAALADCGLEGIAVVALAKERRQYPQYPNYGKRTAPSGEEGERQESQEGYGAKTPEEVGHKPERVYLPGMATPITFPATSPELLLLQEIRDEAHRFALRYHRRLRGKI